MRSLIATLACAVLAGACSDAQTASPLPDATTSEPTAMPIYDLTYRSLDNQDINLADFKGRPILLVNTASKCGYTPQYDGLEALWQTHRDRGLVVLGVPSDNFGGQEFASDEKIAEFCKLNFGVTFPLLTRSDVTGANRIELYSRAEAAIGESAIPQWNFHKILIGPDGVPSKAYPSSVKPDDAGLLADIEALL